MGKFFKRKTKKLQKIDKNRGEMAKKNLTTTETERRNLQEKIAIKKL